MSADLHARLVAALDEEQARAEAAGAEQWDWNGYHVPAPRYTTYMVYGTPGEREIADCRPEPWVREDGDDPRYAAVARHIAAQDPARTLARVAADRRVLERHWNQHGVCNWCGDDLPWSWPCPDALDLAARYGIEVEL